jgi:Uma2 family endonuclease
LRTEYERLVESGAFEDERVELLEGMLVTMTPQDAGHAYAVQRLAEVLLPALRGRAVARIQSPLAIGPDSEPEPDVAVVPLGDYSTHHPTEAQLVVEVATTSVRRDRFVKGPLYARAGVPEYWIVDVASRTVHVCRTPAGAEFGEVTVHGPDATLRVSMFPDVEVPIRSVLPARG